MSLELPEQAHQTSDALRYVLNSARHDWAPEKHLTFGVDTRLRVSMSGRRIEGAANPYGVLAAVYAGAHTAAFAHALAKGWVRVHAAGVDGHAGRVLIVGASGSGKTTLACQLLVDGVAVVCDESVIVRHGRSLPVARRFHLKPGVEDLVPAIGPFTSRLPAISDGAIRALDPAEAGFTWRLSEAPVSHVVLLTDQPGRGMRPSRATVIMPQVLEQTFSLGEPTGKRLSEVAALLRTARCWTLGRIAVADAAQDVAALAGSTI